MRLHIIIIELVECLDGKNWEHTFSFITGRENASTLFNLSSHDTQNTYDQGKAGSRDDMGEPLVTTYHYKFMGTVDYIWYICSVWGNCISIFELYGCLVILIWWSAMNWILEHLILQKLQIGSTTSPSDLPVFLSWLRVDVGTKTVTGFRFFHRWDRWSFACSTFDFANSTCDCSSGEFEGWCWYSWPWWECHPMRIGGGFGVEANLGNAHFSLKGMWSVISKP